MKRFLIAFLLMLLLAPHGFARDQSVLARVTVYWASGGGGSDRWTRRHICSTGARLAAGHCAVDPRRIPYGSRVTLPDATLLAVDTGSAVVSRKAARRAGRTALERGALVIDRFFETKQQAVSWANRNPYFMFVRVSPPDFRASLISRPQQLPQASISHFPQQPIATPPQSSPSPRRSLEDRPRPSSMYAR
jgi:3D (Asp-Asp-Asp) domain-containing protein